MQKKLINIDEMNQKAKPCPECGNDIHFIYKYTDQLVHEHSTVAWLKCICGKQPAVENDDYKYRGDSLSIGIIESIRLWNLSIRIEHE